MIRSGARVAFGSRVGALSTLVLLGAMAGDAHATETSAGAPALGKARAAWNRGALNSAEPLYREAIEKGGLAPEEVLEGYVRLGAIRAARGKAAAAVAAFRAAAIIDSTFTVPSRAGRKGPSLAAKAKRETATIGSIRLALVVAAEPKAREPFKVTATLDRPHLTIAKKIGVVARDPASGKEIVLDATPEESVEFEIGAELASPGADLVLRVDALDGRKNRLASAEKRVHIGDEQQQSPVAASGDPPAHNTAPAAETKKLPHFASVPPARDSGTSKKSSFWSTPWPYVIGGAALACAAGAGAGIYFGTRPPSEVTVGTVSVRAQ